MVAGSAAFYLEHGVAAAAASPSNKCRYKTGKCTNARSSKRNGQPHMLCLYHRDKANKIQRKFDRQKRQSVRMKKTSSASDGGARSSSTMAAIAGGAASAFAHSMAASSSFSGLLAAPHHGHELDIYSDSDSSRFSTDSEGSRLSTDSESGGAAASLDLVWQDLPHSSLLSELADSLATPTALSCGSSAGAVTRFHGPVGSGALSHEEIDFLYSAMLE